MKTFYTMHGINISKITTIILGLILSISLKAQVMDASYLQKP